MNKQKQIEAMARLEFGESVELKMMCGFSPTPLSEVLARFDVVMGWVKVPDYFTDNEIDRMVRGLDADKCYLYIDDLELILATREEWSDLDQIKVREFVWLQILKATTEQKVEAYLKAKGAWEDE